MWERQKCSTVLCGGKEEEVPTNPSLHKSCIANMYRITTTENGNNSYIINIIFSSDFIYKEETT
jgi:hypothetical protein